MRSQPNRSRNKKCTKTCCFVTLILILIIIALILFFRFYLFKSRAPKISTSDITLQNFAFSPTPTFTINITLGVMLDIKNPNYVDFNYQNFDSKVFYHDTRVGLASIPAGMVKARSTASVNTTVYVDAATMEASPYLVQDLGSGFLTVDVYTSLTGKVVIAKVFKMRARIESTCTVIINFADTTSGTACTSKIHLKM